MLFINAQTRIDVKYDSIYSALLKKANNKSLSHKTLKKLAKISSTSIGVSKSDAKQLFIKNKPISRTFESEILSYDLEKALAQVANDEIRTKLNVFIHNCSSALPLSSTNTEIPCCAPSCTTISTAEFIEAHGARIGRIIGEGAEGIVVEDSENSGKVLKIFFNDTPPIEITKQVDAFKRFYGADSACAVSSGIIQLDKIDGVPLSQVNTFPDGAGDHFIKLLHNMMSKGCPPTDLSEDNFLYDLSKNEFYPIDMSSSHDGNIDVHGVNYILTLISEKSVM